MIEKLPFACTRTESGEETDIAPPHPLVIAEKLNEVIEAMNRSESRSRSYATVDGHRYFLNSDGSLGEQWPDTR